VLGVLTIAAQLAIVAHAPDTVFACDAVEVSVAVSTGGSAVPRVKANSFRPFDLLRHSSTPRVQYRPHLQRSAILAEYRYTITTDRVGSYTIPPFEATIGQERVFSRPLSIFVRPMRGRAAPAVIARARIDTSSGLTLGAAAPAETVYVGQQATYEVAVFLNQTVRDRLRRNPTFYPPEMQAMLAYDLPTPNRATRERVGSQCFDALVYRRALFPLVPGRLVIPPAQLVYSTGLSSSSLFSREESHELQTDSVMIVAIEPPSNGRPQEYAGAVGEVQLDARLDSTVSRVGDPMLITLRVAGTGNVKLFPRPIVRVPWAGLVAADERVRVDSNSSRIGGSKEFDWVLTPRIAGEFDVPPVRYGYFNPGSRRYEVAVAPGSRIRVAPGALASADTGQAEGALAIRTAYGGPTWPPLQSQPVFWLALLLAPVPALVSGVRQRRADPKRATPPDPMRALITTAASDSVVLRRQYVKALAHRLGCSPEDFTHPGALERALRRAGASDETATRAEALLRALDAAAYAGEGTPPTNAARKASAVALAVDEEALRRAELPFWIPAIIVAISLTAVSTAIALDPAAVSFARGVSAYVREEYGASQQAFGEAVQLAPASPDAWANYGTASWAVADTATAVLAWRQGLALEPNATDLQQYLMVVRDLGPTSPGWVPALPRNATVWLFGSLWIAAWGLAWVSRRRPTAAHAWWTSRLPLPLAAAAVVVGLAAIEIESRIAGNRLAVVRHAMTLSSDPAIGMDRGPLVGTGEIVRVVGRRGGWTRVEATDDRDGWIASAQLFDVADRRLPRN
jgi:hypothetical protein